NVEAAKIFSSSKKSTELNEFPDKALIHSPVSTFQILTVLSADPVTKIFSFNLASLIHVDGWIQHLMQCKQLQEADVKRLCDK
ncbi:22956_t:CDS:2, partial [Entrophospora sp. SA101]